MGPVWLQFVQLLFDLLKGLAWPASAAFIAWLFRSELRGLLPRLRRVGSGGVEFDPDEQKREARNLPPKPKGDLPDLPGLPPRSAVVAELERQLHEQIEALKPEELTDRLVRALAEVQIHNHLLYTYTFIFGSQITGLRELNNSERVRIGDAKAFFYEEVRMMDPEFYRHSSYEDWIAYPKARLLVEEKDGFLAITDMGREFVRFIDAKQLPPRPR